MRGLFWQKISWLRYLVYVAAFCSLIDGVYVLLSFSSAGYFFSFSSSFPVVRFGREPEEISGADGDLLGVELADHVLQNEGTFRDAHVGLFPRDVIFHTSFRRATFASRGEHHSAVAEPLSGVSPDKKCCTICAFFGSIFQSIVNCNRIHISIPPVLL